MQLADAEWGALMTVPQIGETARVSHAAEGGFRYVFHVDILSIEGDTFVGRVGSIFAEGDGEIIGGKIVGDFMGKEIQFRSAGPCGVEPSGAEKRWRSSSKLAVRLFA